MADVIPSKPVSLWMVTLESDQKKMLLVLPPDADSVAAEAKLRGRLPRKYSVRRVDPGVLFTSIEFEAELDVISGKTC